MLSFGILSTSCAQNDKAAPAAVQTAFKSKFPTAQKAKWDKEGEGEWEAEFKMNGKEMSANFKTDGTWVETETEIEESDLPQAVKDAIATLFAGYDAEEAAMVETPDQPTAYEVELEKGETTVEALFNADGTLLKQKNEEEDDDEGGEEGDDDGK
jgi:putative PepSY-like beta-lactamase-inhibitor